MVRPTKLSSWNIVCCNFRCVNVRDEDSATPMYCSVDCSPPLGKAFKGAKCLNMGCEQIRNETGYCGPKCAPGGPDHCGDRQQSNIGNGLQVEAPRRDSVYLSQAKNIIKWASSSNFAFVTVSLCHKQSRETIYIIARNEPNRGYIEWQPPATLEISDDYIVKVENAQNSQQYVYSHMFCIFTPQLSADTQGHDYNTGVYSDPIYYSAPSKQKYATKLGMKIVRSVSAPIEASTDLISIANQTSLTSVIRSADLKSITFLSSGYFAKSWTAIYKEKQCCVKVYNILKEPDEHLKDLKLLTLQTELTALIACSHPNILALKGVLVQQDLLNGIGVITELAEFGTLYSYLHTTKKLLRTFLYNAILWALQIVEGMMHLEKMNIVHRELKSPNVLLFGDLNPASNVVCKISGFGQCQIPGRPTPPPVACAYRWMPPEMFETPLELFTSTSDTYSFSIIFSELLSGLEPFPGRTDAQVAYEVLGLKVRPALPASAPASLVSLINRCWHATPEMRPSFCAIRTEIQQLNLYTTFAKMFPLRRQSNAVPSIAVATSITSQPQQSPSLVQTGMIQPAYLGAALQSQGASVPIMTASVLATQDHLSDARLRLQYSGLTMSTLATVSRSDEDVPPEKLVVNDDEIQILGTLGKGAFGVVHSANYLGRQVALKVSSDLLSPKELQTFESEVSILIRCKHANIVSYLGRYQSSKEGQVGYLCELADFGSLDTYLAKPYREVTGAHVLSFSRDIAAGMEYLISLDIIHRDLKSLNILLFSVLNSLPRAKICDFGLSRQGSQTMMVTFAGSLCWTAPEFLKDHLVNKKTDVYSFGIVVWEIITRCMPYHGFGFGFVAFNVVTHGLRPHMPAWVPPFWQNLMMQSWNADYQARPSFADIVQMIGSLGSVHGFDDARLGQLREDFKQQEAQVSAGSHG